MSTADGERIAPVTWLFGSVPNGSVPNESVLEKSVPEGSVSAESVAERHSPSAESVAERHSPSAESVAERHSPSVGSPVEPTLPVFRGERETQAEEQPERGRFERVSNVSMYALARRGMSSREMRDYFLGREFDDAEVGAEIQRLEGVGLLDDTALAETLVRTLRDRKGFGRSALTAELRRRHLDGTAIETAIGSLDDDELERAVDIAAKRAPQLRGLDSATAKRRLGAFLMRKGYSGSIVGAAVTRALAPSGPIFR